MGILLAVVVVVVGVAVAGAVALAASSRRKYARQGQIVPGVESKAPASWAGAHSPEAKLHRRLVDAVAAVQANPALDVVASASATVAIEAVALSEKLEAVAALPASVRAEPMARITAAVEALEAAAATIVLQQIGSDPAALSGAVADVDERMKALAEARAELDRTDPT